MRWVPAAWVLFAVCWAYVAVAVVLPLAALLLTSFQRFATVICREMQFTLANYADRVRAQAAVASRPGQQPDAGPRRRDGRGRC